MAIQQAVCNSFKKQILEGQHQFETGGDEYIIQEDYIVGDMSTDKTAQNELFETLDDTVLDFSESNPFGDEGSAD